MALKFRDRFFTPKVANAIVSPSAIIATGAGVAVGVLVTGGLIPGIVGGVLFLGARILAAVPRNPKSDRIDPFALSDPWRRLSQEAVTAQRQFGDVVRGTDAGPLRDRLADMNQRVDDGVDQCWKVARAGHALSQARKRINLPSLEAELAGLGSERTDSSAVHQTRDAVVSQVTTAKRMDSMIQDTHDRLRLSCAKLDEAVTRAVELSVSTVGDTRFDDLSDALGSVVGDMEALRQAIDVVDSADVTTQPQLPKPELGGTAQPG